MLPVKLRKGIKSKMRPDPLILFTYYDSYFLTMEAKSVKDSRYICIE